MRRLFWPVAIITVLALTAARQGVAQVAAPAMVGRWTGEAKITVGWTKQRVLPIDITIFLGDTIHGRIGNALLDGGRLEKGDAIAGGSVPAAMEYVIVANLDGAIIRADNIWRPSVRLEFNRRDTILEGVLSTSGWPLLSREIRTIAATFALQRARIVAVTTRPANAELVVLIPRPDSGKTLSRRGGSLMSLSRCCRHRERE